jgi:hypothetical protein
MQTSGTRRAATMLVALALAGLLSTGAAIAQAKRPSVSDEARYREHRRLTEEGERASRAMPPSPAREKPLDDGIEQIQIDASKRSGFFKDESKEPNADVARLSAAGVTPQCPYQQGWKIAGFVKAFAEVSWYVCVRDMGLKSLWVGPVYIKRSPGSPWMTVLYQAGLADIFVPYHQTNFRAYDLRWTTNLDQVSAQDAGINGTVRYLTNETVPTVVTELRERGVAWLCKEVTSAVRRGQEFVVWGVADGGNYDNIVQYSFRDDGSMHFRTGNTGYNSPPMPTEPHTHNSLWRIDMDLNGAGGDTAYWLYHQEPQNSSSPLKAQDFKAPFIVEGRRQWSPPFTSLVIEDSTANAFGNKIGYEFTPVQSGVARHYGPQEAWTRSDFYVTRYHGSELGWITAWAEPDNYLLSALNAESVTNNDLVVWMKSAAHHHPNDEDKANSDIGTFDPLHPGGTNGVTLAHWSGIDIEPHNLFNANPMGGPPRCGP